MIKPGPLTFQKPPKLKNHATLVFTQDPDRTKNQAKDKQQDEANCIFEHVPTPLSIQSLALTHRLDLLSR